MEIINLPNESDYFDLYSLTSYSLGDSVFLSNKTSKTLFVATQPLAPTSDTYPIEPEQEIRIVGEGDPIWIKGSVGPIIVQDVVPLISKAITVDLPLDVYTTEREGLRRQRVEVDRTGFFAGREFRLQVEFDIPNGQTLFIKFNSGVDFMLLDQTLNVHSGDVRLAAIDDSGVEGGTFTPLTIFSENTMSFTPAYATQVVASSGGTYTGGVEREVFRVKTAGATAQQTTIGGGGATERGRPASTTYIALENKGNGTSEGIYSLVWQEIPNPLL